MRSWLCALAIGLSAVACGGGGNGGDASIDADNGDCPAGATTGMACSAAGDCLTIDRFDCSQTVTCHCDGTHYTCNGVADGSSCAAFAGAATCETEGTGVCDSPPAGGTCNCGSDDVWSCADACPAGCPATEPTDGAGCTPDGLVCPYGEGNRQCCSCGSDALYHCGGCDQG